MVFAQVNLHKGGVHSGVAGVDRGQVGRDADIGDDHLQIAFGNDGADIVLNLRDVFVGNFQARTGGRLDVNDELTGIGAWEVGASDKGEKNGEEHHDGGEDVDGGAAGAFQRTRDLCFVIIQQALEEFVELVDHAGQPAFGIFVAFFTMGIEANEIGAIERNDGHGKNVGRENGDDHAESQVRKEVTADAVKETDREEYDGGGGSGGEHGKSDFHAALFRGFAGSHALLHEPENVFEDDDGIVDQTGEGERQASQKHGVDGTAHGVHYQETGQRRERNREKHGEGGARAAEEQQNHQSGERKTDAAFFQQVNDCGFYEDGLIEDHGSLQHIRDVDQIFSGFLDSVDDRDGVAIAALLQDRDVHGFLSVDPDNVGLDGAGVFCFTDVSDQHRAEANALERDWLICSTFGTWLLA